MPIDRRVEAGDSPVGGECLISVDIEASGPSPSTGSLIALGACLVADPESAFYRELRPLPERPWLAAAERIHGLTAARLAEQGTEPAAAMAAFADWLADVADGARPIFVGFNAPFDWMFVADYFHRFLGHNPFGVSALDLKSLFMGRDGVTAWSETRRDLVIARHPIRRAATHNALDDAQAQAELAQRLLEHSP